MLQCVLTRGAQEAYSAVCGEDGLDYEAVKAAVWKACELVAEAIRDLNSHSPLNSPQLLKSILLIERIAAYVGEQKPSTALKSAELAEDFVLTLKGSWPIKLCNSSGLCL